MKTDLITLPVVLRNLILLMVFQAGIIYNSHAIDIPPGASEGTKCIDYFHRIDLMNYVTPISNFELQSGSLPPGLSFDWITGATYAEISGVPKQTENFDIVLYARDGLGETTRPVTISINDISAGSSAEICEGGSYTVTDVNYTGVNYSWSENGNGSLTSGALTLSPTYGSVDGDNDPVTLTMTITNQTDNTCTASATKNLTINRNPVADAGPDDAICATENTYILSGASASNGTISWSSSSGHDGFNAPASQNPEYSPGNNDKLSGSVDLTMEVTSTNCGIASSSMTLEINPEPTAGVGTTSDNICANLDKYQIAGSTATNGDINWTSSGDGAFSSNGQTLNPTYTLEGDDKNSTSITLTLSVSDPGGACPTASATITLNVQQPPVVNAGGPGSVIKGTATNYNVTGASVSSGIFSWTENGLGDLNDNSVIAPAYAIHQDDAGTIEFTLTAQEGVCEASDVHEFEILHQPFDLIFVLDISGSMGGSISPGGGSKLQKLRDALEDFFTSNQSEIQANDQIAAIYFSTQVDLTDGSLVNWLASGDALLLSMKSAQCPSSICWTAMGGGLQAAINELISPANLGNGHTKNIILITDGEQNLNPLVINEPKPVKIGDSSDPYYDTYDCGTNPTSPLTVLNGTNSVRIYTIGLNVPVDYFQVLNDVATETGGITNLQLTNPHELFDFLANNFVDILRESSPQIIDYRYRKSGAGTIREAFTVNNNADHITLKIIGGRGNADFYRFRVLKDDVDVTDLGTISDGEFYRIFSADLPVSTSGGLIQAGGEWVLEFEGSNDREYQAVGMISEHGFRYKCSAGDIDYVTGENLQLEAEVMYLDQDLSDARVSCYVLKPGEDMGTLLANTSVVSGYAGRTNVLKRDFRYVRKAYLDQALTEHMSAANLKFRMLMENQEFIEQLSPNRHVVELNYQNGKFRGSFRETELNGVYRLIFKIEWKNKELGKFVRTESRSVVVRFGDPDESNTEVFTLPPSICYKNWRVAVRPVDKYGNLLGPGFASRIDAGKNTMIVDNLEGSYTIVYKNRDIPSYSDVDLYLHGRRFYSGNLDKISTQIPENARKIRRKPARLMLPIHVK